MDWNQRMNDLALATRLFNKKAATELSLEGLPPLR
jgi:hypothetical protein